MIKTCAAALLLVTLVRAPLQAGERTIVSLRDLSEVELKSAGINVSQPVSVHIKALGAGGDYGWTYKSDEMFAYGWIINADTRQPVWIMEVGNTSRSHGDREYNGDIRLDRGSYEVYFSACTFTYHTMFTHINDNVDHRRKPLFGMAKGTTRHFFSFFTDWFSNDIARDWKKRSPKWGIDLLVDESQSALVQSFTPPKESPRLLFKAIGLGDNACIRQGFSLSKPTVLYLYGVGEGRGDNDLVDYGWIVDARDRSRVWEMQGRNCASAGGASKNIQYTGRVDLDSGDYVLYFITDDSHSMADWNASPPYDPLHYGITVTADDEEGIKAFKTYPYAEDKNVIVSLTKVRDSENRSEGFTLAQGSKVRIYALGERNNFTSAMADYGYILDAQSRDRVWLMDAGRTYHAGGASKNRLADEVIFLPKGSYIVNYVSDDSHAYDSWNGSPPFDPDHYGITVMGADEHFSKAIVSKYAEERDKSIIAQIVRVGDNTDREEKFRLNRTTRLRIYAIGEGQNRDMVDYGWIEDAKTGNVVWEMTYAMTFHAGGARKNRMVNTSIILDKGEYKLHYKTDDSHSYGNWNVDPPSDQDYYGITLFRDEAVEAPTLPPATISPHPPHALPPTTPRSDRK